ncbi:MAG: PEP-CTERM sorting domain-containing protein, partial [Variovorax sp.]
EAAGELARAVHRVLQADGLKLQVSAVPEPQTYALMLAGLAFVAFAAKRRKQAAVRG